MAVDLHSHVLPGLDDGAASLAAAVEICESAVADGTTVLAATPHVRWDYPTTVAAMEHALRAVETAIGSLPLELVPGGEIALEQLDAPLETLTGFGLGGNPEYLLVETPYFEWPRRLVPELGRLRAAGITPVLAHPERNPAVQADPRLVGHAIEAGALIQLTAASLDGRLGTTAARTATNLVRTRSAHLVASDAHAPDVRMVGLSSTEGAVGADLARWLTHDVPLAIVRGAPLPPRPGTRASFLRRR